jgi:ribosomal-protein-alanine N-acetyltransferase
MARNGMVLRCRSVLWDTHHSIEDSESFLRLAIEGYERGDFGGLGVVLKDSGAFIGTCGLDAGYAPEHARAELGYVLSREYWGKGLIPEAVRAIIAFGVARGPKPHRGPLHRRQPRLGEGHGEGGYDLRGHFERAGVLKGAYRDMILYSILRREYHRA